MRYWQMGAVCLILLLLVACGGSDKKEKDAAPVIKSFTGSSALNSDNPALLDVTLTWEVEGDEASLSIDQGVGDVTGKTVVKTSAPLDAPPTYTLTAKNDAGEDSASFDASESSESGKIKGKEIVAGEIDENDALLSDYFEGAVGFYADVYELEPLQEGEEVIVNLTGQGDEGAEFDSYLYILETIGDDVEVVGDIDDLPGVLESYLIEAAAGASYTIIVSSYEPEDSGGYVLETNGAPMISNFTGNPFIVNAGSATSLEWTVDDSAQSLAIDSGIGDVTGSDTAETGIIAANTTFTLFATNRFGTNTSKAEIVLREGSSAIELNTVDSVAIIGPDSFDKNSTVAVSLADLAADESVAIIPVHATQNLDYDRLAYQIEIDNVNPTYQAPALSAQSINPWQRRLGALQQDHFDHLQENLAFLNELKAAGHSQDTLSLQDFDGDCAAPYVVGEKMCDFYVSGDLRDTTLIFESANAYWFLDDEYADELTGEEIADQARRFEDELLGVIETNFGTFQDLDNNGKIFIVMSSLSAFGYVTTSDFVPNGSGELESPFSNEGDIFYAAVPSDFQGVDEDGNFVGITKEDFLELWLPSTLVHELKHLVALGLRFRQFENDTFLGFEEAWFEEGSAVVAEELSPYPSALSGYAQGAANYGLSAPSEVRIVGEVDETFSWYGWNFLHLWKIVEDRGAETFLKPWTAGPELGIENIEKNLGDSFENFPDTMLTWAATLMFDDTGLSLLDKYSYEYDKLNLRDAQENEDDRVFWETLKYEPLEPSVGATRSAAYYVGQGTGETVTISLSSVDAEPYFMVVRFSGELPY